MIALCEILYVGFLALDLLLVSSSRLLNCIRLVAWQGLVLGFIAALHAYGGEETNVVGLGMVVVNLLLKGVVIPMLLAKCMRMTGVRREIEPLVGYSCSAIFALAATCASYFICRRIDWFGFSSSPFFGTVAFSTILIGLFLTISRRKAITQVLGFLVFENGITLFGISMDMEYGVAVELGILLDVFVLVFIMGIAIFQISREFNHIDADRLNQLGDSSNESEEADIPLKEEEA